MNFRFVGTGDSAQVPCFGCDCPACARARVLTSHRRGPCCAEVRLNGRRVLLDAGRPDLADSCEGERPSTILLTHYHADHVQGLFHLRWGTGAPIPVHGPKDAHGCADLYRHPGVLDFRPGLKPFRPLEVEGLTVTPVPLNHSKPTLGYCLDDGEGRLAYLTDTLGLPAETERFLRDWTPDLVVLDATHPAAHREPRNHNNLPLALEILERLGTPQAYLTHIGHDLDAERLAAATSLPDRVALAHDGLSLQVLRGGAMACDTETAS
ncbi:phosphonate metabolism protein PhnP [Halomonas beimenensis]|uniref:Metal-dependent hydrolases of the beta-lactamase superfamily I, PhnP protein n=1 Tax=Halomonas beimenensis TaxID=475662 RepID=A0A291PBV8_9GAMM|nr:phosphonate metabolism protein PhnP [Halomonas beimenensis]ATJ84362.1 metal-dependent hydrolases of the beta-lactamase superfamily I, PhnP protein [Halomonas beimenensis]